MFPDRGAPVQTLQNALNIVLGVENPSNPNHFTADGDFGPKTNHAVGVYQQMRNLTKDGIVGGQTWQALNHDLYALGRAPK
jgi:peptidoglycan hydrolase-like protein with peptidoglycan-binding domain